MMTRSSILVAGTILLSVIHSVTAGRWEEGIFGFLCFKFMEPWACIRDLADFWIEDNCLEYNSTDLTVLMNFFIDTGNTYDVGPLLANGWLSDCDYCNWGGITCNKWGNVTGLDVPDRAPVLTGTIPSELGLLNETLDKLVLHSNEFSGEVPTELGMLSLLTKLELHYNDLTGSMPPEICRLGEWNGKGIYVSADCGRPDPEFICQAVTCCDGCYIDHLRGDDKLVAKDLEFQNQEYGGL